MKEIRIGLAALSLKLGIVSVASLWAIASCAQNTPVAEGPPPSSGGVFPLKDVRKGMTATAWTVFAGSKPEPMQVEILGVLRGARGPGHDMILAQLHGAKPEYTGVVAGMSGSPVYIGGRLLGSLSYRIGQFSKDPIAGITPIEQMMEVRDLPIDGPGGQGPAIAEAKRSLPAEGIAVDGMNFQAMETPLVMSGFRPEAIRLWQQRMEGTGLEMVAAGGMGGSPVSGSSESGSSESWLDLVPSSSALATVVPGSAISADCGGILMTGVDCAKVEKVATARRVTQETAIRMRLA